MNLTPEQQAEYDELVENIRRRIDPEIRDEVDNLVGEIPSWDYFEDCIYDYADSMTSAFPGDKDDVNTVAYWVNDVVQEGLFDTRDFDLYQAIDAGICRHYEQLLMEIYDELEALYSFCKQNN